MTAPTADAGGRSASEPTVLFVDNFDSFTYNLVEYVEESLLASSCRSEAAASEDVSERADTEVLRNTASLDEVRAVDPDAIVISPGPGHPGNDRDVGVTNDVLLEVSPDVPTLGVCLGLEAAVYAYGGTVGRAPDPIHGKAYPVHHDGEGVFAGIDQGFRGGRYHSLVATEVPDCFAVTATTDHHAGEDGASAESADAAEPGGAAADGGTELVMGIRHREHPIEAVQFHPESVLTAAGHDVIENFLDGV